MKTRQRILYLIGLACIILFLMGMTGLGSSPDQSTIPSAFNAKLTDIADSEVEISSVTIDGKTTFNGYMGKGKVQIPFENISRIEISKDIACITLKETGDMCDLRINSISRLNGKTSFGSYQISLKDIKWIELTKAQ
ncbi:MAG: hypothetical protein JW920_01580 [Deltaproteobacteria bacterium]|nr:hypothetical protein [Deltaproteobacteria bacterium]